MRKTFVLTIAAALLVIGCQRERAIPYHHYVTVSEDGWRASDTLRFSLPETLPTGEYQLDLGMRFRPSFPYRGLWLIAETHLSNPTAVLCDTLVCSMEDSTALHHQGVTFRQTLQPYRKLHLQEGQTAQIRLRHHMTREVIPAITDLGVRFSKSGRPLSFFEQL